MSTLFNNVELTNIQRRLARFRHLMFILMFIFSYYLVFLSTDGYGKEQEMLPYGNLTVSLVNGLTSQPIPYEEVYLNRVEPDGSKTYLSMRHTDQRGLAGFEIDELGTGAVFIVSVRPFNGSWIKSPPFSTSGVVHIEAGLLPVTVVAGDGSGLLPNKKVSLWEVMEDGSYRYRKSGFTDASGLIVFDAPGIGNGRTYVLRAKSPVDGTTKISQFITSKGAMRFTVGNAPLNITLVNGLTGNPVSGQTVVARKLIPDGSSNGTYKWVSSHDTDNNGQAVFDLDGLGSGTKYMLHTIPYNGGTVYTQAITKTGDIVFKVGMLPVTLIDHATGQAMANKKLVVYEKTSTGKLRWKKSGITDTDGIVRFDLEGIDDGRIYVVRVYNPFGDGKRFYSPLILNTGPVEMSIQRGESNRLDLTPPEVSISSPVNGQQVADAGFILKGVASDSQTITNVIVKITDPVKGVTESNAVYNPISGYWEYIVGSAAITRNKNITVEVSAIDNSHNIGTISSQFNVIRDWWRPQLEITSHRNNDRVFSNGFLVSGTVEDNTGVIRIVASVTDSVLGRTVVNAPLETSSDGVWNLVVHGTEITADSEVTIVISAYDAQGYTNKQTVVLRTLSSMLNAHQLINRITFGATPELLSRIQRIGPEEYLTQQLNPDSINDSELEVALENKFSEINSVRELQNYQLIRAIYSNRQLQEVMTWFWENHFNTNIRRIDWELAENNGFRQHALGYFRDLLEVSATSPAMMLYLDNHHSYKDDPNENYARELLELHTLGVHGGYTQEDVVEVARVFTGWRIKNGAFKFAGWAHDYGDKTVLGHFIPGQGMEEGKTVLDILAVHPSTAEFICTKLIKKLVTDEPAASAVSECVDVFLSSGGHIGTVVEHILRSPSFNSVAQYHKKVKTPYEFIAGIMRNFKANPGENGPRYALRNMGMPLFQNPLPTGWAEAGNAWTDSNQLMQRQQYATKAVFRNASEKYTYMQLSDFFLNRGITTAEGVVGFLFQVALGSDYSQTEWDTAIGVLTMDGNMPFDIYDEDAETKLKVLVALVMNYPGYQLQ